MDERIFVPKQDLAIRVETLLGYMMLLMFIFFFVNVVTNLLNALAIGDVTVRYKR